MITDREHYHGIALARIAAAFPEGMQIRPESSGYRNSYVLNERIGLHLKFSGARIAPWSFNFLANQVDEVATLVREFGDAWLIFICGLEGVAGIRYSELTSGLERVSGGAPFNLTITRRPGHAFMIVNPGGDPIRLPESALGRGLARDASVQPTHARHRLDPEADEPSTQPAPDALEWRAPRVGGIGYPEPHQIDASGAAS